MFGEVGGLSPEGGRCDCRLHNIRYTRRAVLGRIGRKGVGNAKKEWMPGRQLRGIPRL